MARKFKQRIAVLVDIQNMFYSAKAHFKGKLNYDKLLDGLSEDRELVRATAYVVERPDVNQEGFYDALNRFGYDIQRRTAKNKVKDGTVIPVKGSYEVMLAADAIVIAPKVDTIVLVTGDGSYAYLAKTLRSLGVRVEVASFEGSTSKELLDEVDGFIYITQDMVISKNEVARPTPIPEEFEDDVEDDVEDGNVVWDDDDVQPESNESGFGILK